MDKGIVAFILGISLMISVPITIGLFAVKGSMDNISLGNVANGMEDISGNLERINSVLGSITEEDLQLIRNVFLMINETLSGGINLSPNLDLNINSQGGMPNTPTVETPNLRRI